MWPRAVVLLRAGVERRDETFCRGASDRYTESFELKLGFRNTVAGIARVATSGLLYVVSAGGDSNHNLLRLTTGTGNLGAAFVHR